MSKAEVFRILTVPRLSMAAILSVARIHIINRTGDQPNKNYGTKVQVSDFQNACFSKKMDLVFGSILFSQFSRFFRF